MLAKRTMQRMIIANGHLVMDGDETTDELRDALIFLSTGHNCRWPEYGVPIEKLIPDITVLAKSGKKPGRPRKSRTVMNVDISDESL